MALLGKFYEDASKVFNITITYGGTNPDITTDTVTLYICNSAGTASVEEEADVSTSGASGIAIFSLTPSDMNITPGDYTATIKWATGDDVHVLVHENVTVVDLPSGAYAAPS